MAANCYWDGLGWWGFSVCPLPWWWVSHNSPETNFHVEFPLPVMWFPAVFLKCTMSEKKEFAVQHAKHYETKGYSNQNGICGIFLWLEKRGLKAWSYSWDGLRKFFFLNTGRDPNKLLLSTLKTHRLHNGPMLLLNDGHLFILGETGVVHDLFDLSLQLL